MKYCKDCIHYEYGYCFFHSVEVVSPVTGINIRDGERRASGERNTKIGSCELEAKNYTRKWWKFWAKK